MEYEPRLRLKESRFSKLVVMLSYLLLVSFTVCCLMLLTASVHIPDSLIYAVFGFFGTEMVALAWRTKNTGGV